ncbi:hypothetical protein AOR13_1867 [Alteromonas stellipolaris LMG 21856]|nr:hypothetical protein AOR13_1867 [Alteromonas stellipolaris LMG 21856]
MNQMGFVPSEQLSINHETGTSLIKGNLCLTANSRPSL